MAFCLNKLFLTHFDSDYVKISGFRDSKNKTVVTFRDERFDEFEGFSGRVELTGMLFEEGFILKIKLEDMLRLKLIDSEMCI